jgi:hypothetical protein
MTDDEPDTEFTPTAHAPEEVQAWSLHETDEIQSARHGRIFSAALITLLCAVVAAVAWFAAKPLGQCIRHSSSNYRQIG